MSIDFLNDLGWIQRGAVNPPFGTKIVEAREHVLREFDLGHVWARNDSGELHPTDDLLAAQETGILFAEAQTWLTESGGAFGIILPNGYLGNTRDRAVAVREFLLRHNRLVSLLAFPRFTFKSSGADVSATAAIFERRESSLRSAKEDDQYMFHAYLIEHIGKQLGDKLNKPLYIRDPETGEPERDKQNELQELTDLPDYLDDLRRSAAIQSFPWLIEGITLTRSSRRGHSVPIAEVLNDPHLTMDAKRFSPKYRSLVDEIRDGPYFRLGDLVDFVPEERETTMTTSGKERQVRRHFDRGGIFRYVDIENISDAGTYTPETMRGWQLPERARRVGRKGDIFVAAIWSSVRKWALVNHDDDDLLFTNGCHQLRMRPGAQEHLVDVIAGLARESYVVQMRALARGSDGLAEITETDAASVLIARVEDPARRAQVQGEINRLLAGQVNIRAVVAEFSRRDEGAINEPPRRASHTSLV
jgi:type I restriction enzyme M protein